MEKSADAFRTISEVATELDVPQHVLRFWETRFPQVKPLKRGGSRRYYRPQDVDILRHIRHLLYDQGYTIKGVQRLLRETGARAAFREAARQQPAAGSGNGRGTEVQGQPARPEQEAAATAASGEMLGPEARRRLKAILAELTEARALLRRG
ncbi:MAG: MerR family transcriptional regulator [Alphaproteobacteria bacterium]|nr:MerR family transcriptional regulator [Alphaproteobacteria bacterium]